jgi:hypothetical protein
MVWTLRFYDSDDVEIGWVEIEPYNYEITHPDGAGAWENVEFVFRNMETPSERGVRFDTIAGQQFHVETLVVVDVSGREHAEYIEEEARLTAGVASTAIADD